MALLLAFSLPSISYAQEWEDISYKVNITNSQPFFNRLFRTHASQVSVESRFEFPIVGPIRLIIKDANLPVYQPDGFDRDGNPYIDFPADKIVSSKELVQINFIPQGRVRPIFSIAVERYNQNTNCSASHCFADAVFFTTADMPVNLSINYDNSSKAWSVFDEMQSSGEQLYNLVRNDAVWVTHSLYPVFRYETDFNQIQIFNHDTVVTYPNKQYDAGVHLGDRTPLILIHGWQGGKSESNYIGFLQPDNVPAAYFQEFLAFFQSESPEAVKLREKYKLFVYKYPSFEHITYNGRMLGEAINSTPQIRDFIASGKKIDIIGHSMGGLVARSFIEEHGLGAALSLSTLDDASNVKGIFNTTIGGSNAVGKLITLATPHHGSPAAGKSWVDSGDFIKERGTPGALDLMWDNFDRAVDVMLTSQVDLANALRNDFYDENGQKIFFFRERGVRAGDGVDDFDKFYKEIDGFTSWKTNENGQCVTTDSDSEYICYEHPNPWLKQLNSQYFEGSSGDVKYYLYAGFLKADLFGFGGLINSINNNNGLEGAHDFIKWEAFYSLNDSATVSASGFLDKNTFSDVTGWQRIWDNSDSVLFANRSDKILIDDQFVQFSSEGQNQYRFFYDYDHTQMKGGAGAQGYQSSYSPLLYKDNWNSLSYLLSYLDEIGVRYEGLDYSPSELLKNEPLFIAVSIDLNNKPIPDPAREIFSDNFERPDSSDIGNGWTKLIGGSGIELVDGAVRVNVISGENLPPSGIYRFVDYVGDVTLKGKIFETNGFSGLSNRYLAAIGILGDGTPSSGYHIVFTRSDRNYNNSEVQLFDSGTLVQRVPSSFQFGSDITFEVTFREDGAVSGKVSGNTQQFEFDFAPRSVESSGDYIYFEAIKPDVRRTSTYRFHGLDEFSVIGVSKEVVLNLDSNGKDIWTTSVFSVDGTGNNFPGGGRNDEYLQVGGWGDRYHSLIQFNLEGLPTAVSSARIELYVNSSLDSRFTPIGMLLDVVNEDWDWREGGTGRDRERLWWADRPSSSQWSLDASNPLPIPVAGEWYSIDITNLYNGWRSGSNENFGIQLRPLGSRLRARMNYFSSSNSEDESLRPRLVLTPVN
jgi:pimeloyl-ACP methyl ester carboxylesterase